MATPAPSPLVSNQAAGSVPQHRHRWRRPRRNGGFPIPQQTSEMSDDQHVDGRGTAGQAQLNAPLSIRPHAAGERSEALPTERSSAGDSGISSGVVQNEPNRGGRRGGLHEQHGSRNAHGPGVGRGSRGTDSNPRHVQGQGSKVPSQRSFGGQLTRSGDTDASSSTASSLQASAPEFRPGEQYAHHPKQEYRGKAAAPPRTNARIPRLRRGSSLKSTAPDITTRTHEDISHGIYECPICTSELGRSSKVWSCRTCWTVFHLSCIKRWSKNEGSTLTQQQPANGDIPPPRQWRCPGCNLPQSGLPSTYSCWCGKEVDPKPISGIPPHSCGQTCGKSRVLPMKCPHPCELFCHAGPCPPCSHMGPVQSCFCGKKSVSKRCVDTNYDTGWSCGEVCGDLMPCGEHTCQRECHEGLCGACDTSVDGRCYCGKVERSIACCERGDEKESEMKMTEAVSDNDIDQWVGMFDCGQACGRMYDCGKHRCEKRCHPQDVESPHCPRSPDVVSHCPCGKTRLEKISSGSRQSCGDPIPNCNEKCLKKLACGHPCQQICHSGECMPCLLTVSISCRCGRTSSSTICHQGSEDLPQCTRICKASLNCGRHECGERCCPGERRAAERQASKRKLRPLGSASRAVDEGFEAEHICTRLCGRSLKCGNHTCPELCHRGACGSCREAIFDELSCHCGRTVLQPPLPCGTKPPACRFECERPKSCGHPQVSHNCHDNDESCPKCPFLTEKGCMCNKRRLKNQPCWLADVRCGEVCGRKLKCGSHFCRKLCHKPGDCEDAGKACQQACGKAKKVCGHSCEEACHAPYACREDKPCAHKFFITCECQHLKQDMKCNASNTSEGNSKKTLACDDECARLERNRKLALALNIDPDAHKDDHIPYSADTLKMFQENVKWAQTQEREFRVFGNDEHEKRLRFKPMQPHHRAFLHALAEDYGLDSESMDPEPHRHVAIFKTPRYVMAPTKTLAECVKVKAALASSAEATAESSKKSNPSTISYNGFLLSAPRFGLTVEEVRSELSTTLTPAYSHTFEISFLPTDEVVLKAHPTTRLSYSSDKDVEAALKSLKPALALTIHAKHLASTIQLCALDSSLNIVRREVDDAASKGGWSQVAAKAAAPRRAPVQAAVGAKSVYTVLGSRLAEAKRKREREEKEREKLVVVDDWEAEVRREEEEEAEAEVEKVASGGEEGKSGADGRDGASTRDSGEQERVVGSETDAVKVPLDEVGAGDTAKGEAADIAPTLLDVD